MQSPRNNDYVRNSDEDSDDEGPLLAATSSPPPVQTKAPPLPPSEDLAYYDFSLDPEDEDLTDLLGPREIINKAIKTVEKTSNVRYVSSLKIIGT